MQTLEKAATDSMQEKVEQLKKRRDQVMLGGGADKLEKQRQAGQADGARTRRGPGGRRQLR